MRSPSDPGKDEQQLREKLIGLGEYSHRKSYYPELQKRLEELERFRAFLDYSHDAIFLIEVPGGRIVDFNDSASRQTGRGHDELLKLSVFDVFDLAGNALARDLIGAGDGIGKQRAWIETNLLRRDAEPLPAELTLARMLFRETAYVIVVARDISKRKAAETALGESEKRRLRLQTQLEFAAQVQEKLLPTEFPQPAGFEVAARCRPAYQVGGDFYDWQQTGPGRFALTLGDVMGKGLAAAMLMATVRASLRAVAQIADPSAALRQAERALRQDLGNSESFVTLFHGQLEVATRRMTFVDCGHGLVFLLRADGRVEELLPRGLPLGVEADPPFQEGEVLFAPGDALVLFSDGLMEAMQQTELDNESLAKQLWAQSAREMVDRLLHVTPSATLPPDDMTLVVLKCTGEA
jgi:phosphoserine phosphatase RsbU/P